MSAPAFFVRAVEKARVLRADLQAVEKQPVTIRSKCRYALVPDATRRGGVRVTRVFEMDRFEGLSGSLVMETRLPAAQAQHYLPWHRMAVDTRAAAVKLRALLRAGLTPSSASFARAA